MNLTRCENGHFYDAERFTSCPHCSQPIVATQLDVEEKNVAAEPAVQEEPKDNLAELKNEISESKQTEDGAQATIGYFGQSEPVVGWLVSIEGSNYGQDFRLKTGRNFIGRAMDMDVSLTDDSSISRDKHAIILFEPKSGTFLVQPGDAKELFYLNDKVVLTATEISAYDVISLGATKLLFVPCCCDKFNWNTEESK